MDDNSIFNRELLTDGCFPVTKKYYYKEWKDFSMPFHSHNAVEVMYVISGSCLIQTRNSSFEMRKAELIFINANVEHRLQVSDGRSCRMFNLEFGFDRTGSLLPSFAHMIEGSSSLLYLVASKTPFFVSRDTEEVYITLKAMIMELDRKDEDSRLLLENLFLQLLVKLARLFKEKARSKHPPSLIHVSRALEYIHHNYDRQIQIRDIANAANVNPSYLQRIFKEEKRNTINEYLTALRINKAKALLSDTGIKISDINEYVGISSREYFSFVFRKHTGMAPAKFRDNSQLTISSS